MSITDKVLNNPELQRWASNIIVKAILTAILATVIGVGYYIYVNA